MKTRQNPLSKFESFVQRVVEGPFAFIFPSKLEPVELARKLERSMEDNLLQGVGRPLAPNVYDIYLSIKDHQRLAPSQTILVKEWQDNLVNVARQRHYTLKTVPVLRMHSDSSLRPGVARIEAGLVDRQHMGQDSSGDGGFMATQALSAEQLAQLRAQLPAGQQLPGIPALNPAQPGTASMGGSMGGQHSNPSLPLAAQTQITPPMPQAWLTIRVPPSGQQMYRIEKPVINIGRQLSNDIIVEDKRVSRYHAQIKYQPNGQFAIFDLGSTNGITVNGTPGIRQHGLRAGDRFTIGSYDFYFERR
ncbi:MAG: DUF3662 and FHA domain-containing protein [Chloroflexota bacterium]|nr:DUF3662 and FHA domain-containing protein [Chloroflexota bacterium]